MAQIVKFLRDFLEICTFSGKMRSTLLRGLSTLHTIYCKNLTPTKAPFLETLKNFKVPPTPFFLALFYGLQFPNYAPQKSHIFEQLAKPGKSQNAQFSNFSLFHEIVSGKP